MIKVRDILSTKISKILGTPKDQITLILTILSIIPLSLINHFIKGKNFRLLYSFIIGFYLQYSIYGKGIIHTLISTIITYLFMKYLGRKISAFVILIGTMIYLSTLNIIKMFHKYGEWALDDESTIYMMVLCKLSSMAFSYEDGEKNDKDFISIHQREYKIINCPSLLEILSFVYFYPTCIIGPSLEYKDFINWINFEGPYKNLYNNKKLIFFKGLEYFIYSFIVMGLYAFLGPYFPIEKIADINFRKKLNYPYFMLYLWISCILYRTKYYSGWILSYSTFIWNGIAYSEKKDKNGLIKKDFECCSYGSFFYGEFGLNPNENFNYWNRSVHLWLKYSVFTRVINLPFKIFKNNYSLAQMITFIFSAFWHGFYSSYYITFLLLFFLMNGNGTLIKLGFYDYVRKNYFLMVIVSIWTAIVFSSIGIFFYNLNWDKAIYSTLNMNFFPFITVGIYNCFRFVFKVPKKKVNDVNEKDNVKKNINNGIVNEKKNNEIEIDNEKKKIN